MFVQWWRLGDIARLSISCKWSDPGFPTPPKLGKRNRPSSCAFSGVRIIRLYQASVAYSTVSWLDVPIRANQVRNLVGRNILVVNGLSETPRCFHQGSSHGKCNPSTYPNTVLDVVFCISGIIGTSTVGNDHAGTQYGHAGISQGVHLWQRLRSPASEPRVHR